VSAPTVVVTGVECTGKTTLAGVLAERLGAALVPEVARGWLDARGGRYDEADLVTLARLQARAEAEARASHGAVVADTDLTVIRVWSEVRFGRCDPAIAARLDARPPAVYLLPTPDLPWVADGQRESPDADERRALHARYRALLADLGHPWAEIGGAGAGRTDAAVAALERLGVAVSG
jgi:nicotinamide riboside kinase